MLQRVNMQINKDNTYGIQAHPQGRFVLYANLLPVLREARVLAEYLKQWAPPGSIRVRAESFLDATKEVEG